MRSTRLANFLVSTALIATVLLASITALGASVVRADLPQVAAGRTSAWVPRTASSAGTPAAPPELAWTVVSRRPHDPRAWTQGLQLDPVGRLFESTGLPGRSTLREVDPLTGDVLRSVDLPDDRFGEGLALVDDRLLQLTWQDGIATVWDVETFDALETFEYEGEGWGLCHDGERLVMSDGSDRLTFRDPDTFEVLGEVSVTSAGRPEALLNELECVEGDVWANVWRSDRIVRIDPDTGEVTASLDLAGILEAAPIPGSEPPDVLNGIAWDATAGTFLVTGKLWPELIEIRVGDVESSAGSADA